MAKTIEQLVSDLIFDITEGTELTLVDVEYIREKDWYLRIFIDKPSGIGIDDCQWLSEKIGERLDSANIIQDSYYLEVSSPGLDRPLKKAEDFVRYAGKKVEINTFAPLNGSKHFVGILKGLIDNVIVLDNQGVEVRIEKDKASLVRLYIEF